MFKPWLAASAGPVLVRLKRRTSLSALLPMYVAVLATVDILRARVLRFHVAMAQKICDELQPNPAFFFGELIDRRERHAHLSRRAQLEVVVYFSHDFDAALKIVPGKAI